MSLRHRICALVCALAYALRRSRLGFVSLSQAVIVGCFLAAALNAYLAWTTGLTWAHAVLVVGCLALATSLLWANTRDYVTFKERTCATLGDAVPLRPDEKMFVRASGTFAVSDMERYLVDVPVVFWSTELGEHILAAKVRALNFLGIGVPSGERGWWYVFLEPQRIRDIVSGEVAFGVRVRPAVRLVSDTGRGPAKLYISCDSWQDLSILQESLRGTVPP